MRMRWPTGSAAPNSFSDSARLSTTTSAPAFSSASLHAWPYRKGTSNIAKKSRLGAMPWVDITGRSLRAGSIGAEMP
jgi:hypothetical protein